MPFFSLRQVILSKEDLVLFFGGIKKQWYERRSNCLGQSIKSETTISLTDYYNTNRNFQRLAFFASSGYLKHWKSGIIFWRDKKALV